MRKRKQRDGYPADCGIVGRRAREVMPAAMRALVRMSVLWVDVGIAGASLHADLRIATIDAAGSDQSAGVTLTRTRMRSPGS